MSLAKVTKGDLGNIVGDALGDDVLTFPALLLLISGTVFTISFGLSIFSD